jgi:putative ABC transport system substrate-binding protein
LRHLTVPFCLWTILWATLTGLDAAAAPEATPRIGVLFWHESPNDELAFEGFRSGLELAGIRPAFDIRQVHSDADEARRHLERWDSGSHDLVLALGTAAAQMARRWVRSTPVLYTAVTNPVLSNVADSWESSGGAGNVAGNSNWIPADTLLRAFSRAVPDLKRLGVISSRGNPVPAAEIEGARDALAAFPERRIELEVRQVDDPSELTAAAESLSESVDALWIPIDILVYENLPRIRRVTDPRGIPLLSSSYRAAEEGAIVSLLVDYRNLGEHAAGLAVRILEDGVEPADLPVGTLRGYRTIVDLRRAREIGYRLPLKVLCTADRLIR